MNVRLPLVFIHHLSFCSKASSVLFYQPIGIDVQLVVDYTI